MAPENRGHRRVFRRRDRVAPGLSLRLPHRSGTYQTPLLAALVLGGLPLLYDLLRKLLKREFGSDLLGGISIITSVWLGDGLMVTTDFSAARTSDERETAGR